MDRLNGRTINGVPRVREFWSLVPGKLNLAHICKRLASCHCSNISERLDRVVWSDSLLKLYSHMFKFFFCLQCSWFYSLTSYTLEPYSGFIKLCKSCNSTVHLYSFIFISGQNHYVSNK